MSQAATSPDGIELRFDVVGAGSPAIVFVHGWSCDRGYWRAQMASFAGRYQVVAIDLAGHGESGLGRADWTMPAFGRDVVAVVDGLGLGRMVLVGHSMGGDVVVEAALRLGDRVAGVVWVDVYRSLEDPRTAEQREARVSPFRRDFHGETYVMERGIVCDLAIVKAWKGDHAGNLVYRKTARNFNPVAATAGRVCVAEVEELVPCGELDPDHVHTPGIYVDRILQGRAYEKRIEQRTVRPRAA